MIKKTITYKNFLDEEETADFYFNMSKGELVKQQMAAINQRTESFQDKLEKITKNVQGEELVAILDEIILDGYGELSTDKKHFVKIHNGQRLVENFMSSGAYSELIVELCTKDNAMADFVNGLVPADLRESVNREVDATQKAQAARERSQASLQGFQKKQEAPKPVVTQVAEVPTIEETAEPILEATAIQELKPVAAPSSVEDLSDDQLRAMLEKRAANGLQQ